MKNKILLIGNEKFTREAYVDGKYIILPKKKYLDVLYDTYSVDNLSCPNLTSDKAISLVSAFTSYNDYDMCVISFGKAEILKNSIEMFEKNLQIIINMLISSGVMPILMDIEAEGIKDLSFYNNVIKRLKKANNVENEFYGNCLNLAKA